MTFCWPLQNLSHHYHFIIFLVLSSSPIISKLIKILIWFNGSSRIFFLFFIFYFFLRWPLRNLNYTKFYKETIWIYPGQKKKNANTYEILQFFCTNKENKKKKKNPIKDKVKIENADMRIIKWPHKFHNRFYATNC